MWHKDAKLLREFAAVSERYTYNPNFSLNVEYVTSVSTGEYITEDEDAVAPDENLLRDIAKTDFIRIRIFSSFRICRKNVCVFSRKQLAQS